jgi:bifunctional non-homologous end joining protein LigD
MASRLQPAAIFAFDLLWLEGKDLRALPLLKRKAALKVVLKSSKRIKYFDHVPEHGERLYAAVERLGLEGIVAKRADSPYRRGRSKDWVKIKTPAGEAEQAKRGEAWNG